jgi:hypothetical protein
MRRGAPADIMVGKTRGARMPRDGQGAYRARQRGADIMACVTP